MKPIKILLLFLLAFISCTEEPEPEPIYYGTYAGTAVKQKPSIRPRVPSRPDNDAASIDYEYGRGWITFAFPAEVVETEVTVTQGTDTVAVSTASPAKPTMLLPESMTGTYELRILTHDGATYLGTLTYPD